MGSARARDLGKAAAARRWVGASPCGEGHLAWAAAHGAYGAVIATEGPGEVEVDGGFVQSDGPRVESRFRLLGQVNDEDAELSWTRFRCFDADTGTWISTDPLGINGGLNLYGFDGAPSDVVDPLGLSVQTGGPHHEIYTAADGTERIRFQAGQAVTLQEATPGRNYSTDSLAGLTKDGTVYVHEGRHRAIGAANGDTIPADVGGIPDRPGWLDYEFSRETAPSGGIPVRDLSIDNSQPDVSAAEADRIRRERYGG